MNRIKEARVLLGCRLLCRFLTWFWGAVGTAGLVIYFYTSIQFRNWIPGMPLLPWALAEFVCALGFWATGKYCLWQYRRSI